MTAPVHVQFLRDDQHGGSSSQLYAVADSLAAFVAAATTSIDIAIYDFRLSDARATQTVVQALTQAADRGVTVRVGFDAGKPSTDQISADVEAVRSPREVMDFATEAALSFAAVGGDPAPPGTADWIAAHLANTKVQTLAIHAAGQLMHSKYVVRDAPVSTSTAAVLTSSTAAVWTGSTNFTDDAWTRQENNIITINDETIATSYRTDFDEMWKRAAIAGSGLEGAGTSTVDGAQLGWDFCPGDGSAVNAALAARIAAAKTRLTVASMVITSHDVLAALAAAIGRGVPVDGIYDGGQMGPIAAQWKANPASAAALADWTTVSVALVAKPSTPYSPTGPHDFMHLKVLIADDTVVTGSYNFSANAERNAENQLHLDDATTVQAYVTYLADVIAAYSS